MSSNNKLCTLVGIKQLSSKIVAAHFHMAASGTNGPIVFDFPQEQINIEDAGLSATVMGDWKLNAAQLKALKAGSIYFDVHTKAHPNGEIRAQIPVAPGW